MEQREESSASSSIQPTGYNYVVSAQKPTVVNAAVVGNFRNATELDMVIARVNRIEHFLVTEEGLKPHREIPIFGRIATLNAFRLPGEVLDSILVLTCKYHLAILSFDSSGAVRTRASGAVADRVGRPAETGIISCVHSSGLIALRLYDGFLKLIQWRDDEELKIFNVRFEDHNVTDVEFLETEKPTVAYFHEDQHGKHLKICEIDLDEKEMLPSLWSQANIETEATLLIPVPQPYGGVVVVGQESISYQRDSNHYTAVASPLIHRAHFNCYARIGASGERYLLGDVSGRLFMLMLIRNTMRDGSLEIKDLKVEPLGNISIPECLVYLDNSVVFVGSRFGDSQLIKLNTEPVQIEPTSFVVVLDTLVNIGPIRDMVLMEKDGQSQIVTCSGCYKDGSLRVVRSGIGIDTLAHMDQIKHADGIFTLKLNSTLDTHLIVATSDGTHLLVLDGEEMEEIDMDGFDSTQRTLLAGNVTPSRVLQVTRDKVRLLSGDGAFYTEWKAPTDITMCAANFDAGQLIFTTGENLYYLRVADDEIKLAGEHTFEFEIACLDISPVVPNTPSKFFAVGFWDDKCVKLFTVEPSIQQIVVGNLGSGVLPRSILIIEMESILYLLVALGDATLIYFHIDSESGQLNDRKAVSLGMRLDTGALRKFNSKGVTNVFCCSDRPAVIYSSNQKLFFSNVNTGLVACMSALCSPAYKNCLVMADENNLYIGTIDDIQKLHVRTVRLGESVSRIVHQPETNTIAILTNRYEQVGRSGNRFCLDKSVSVSCSTRVAHNTSALRHNNGGGASGRTIVATASSSAADVDGIIANDSSGGGGGALENSDEKQSAYDSETHSVCVLNADTFECQYVCELAPNEYGLSLCSSKLSDDPTPYFIVGTAFVYPDDKEPKRGRLLILQLQNHTTPDSGKLRIISEKETKGAVHSISMLAGKLICAINSSVRLLEWTSEKELRLECSHFNNVTALYVKTKGDLALVGDLMRSVCLLSYKPIDSSFEEVARDFSVEWVSACEIIDSDTFLGAENHYNLYCCQKDMTAKTEEDRMQLKQVGAFYLGEMVNVFRRGTIVPWDSDSSINTSIIFNPIMFGTSDGGIGLIMQLSPETYEFLHTLQKRIAEETRNCLRVDHNEYRNFCAEKRVKPWSGFIDGDLIETIADMPSETVEKIVNGLSSWPPMPSVNASAPTDVNMDKEMRISACMKTVKDRVTDVLKFVEDLSRIH